MPIGFDSDRRWDFDEPAPALWARISQVDQYERWWPWLRRFDPGEGLVDGARWRCEVAPPLPYVVRFRLHLTVEDDRILSTVSGDIRGEAELRVDERADGGCTARLRSHLAPANPLLRGVGRVARPMVEWGHDWVLDQGQRQFVEQSARTDPT